MALGLGLGLGLSAFFWLPAAAESGFVRLELARTAMFDYRGGLFAPGRLPPEAVPLPFSTRVPFLDGAFAALYGGVSRLLPAELAVEQALLVALAVAGGIGAGRAAGRPGGAIQVWIWLILGAGLWLLTTTWSAPLWAATPALPMVQFPQRFNGPLSLCIALAAATGLALAGSWRVPLRAAAGVVVGLLALSAIQARPYIADTPPPHDVDGRTLAAQEIDRFGAGTTSGGEFLPRTVYWEQNLPGVHRGLRLYDDAYPQAGWQAGLVRVLEGQGAATAVYQAPGWVGARVEGATPLRLAVHQLLFPGWRAYLDGQPIPLAPVPDRPGVDASLGFMVLEVPAGEHHVEVRFGPTPARAAGAALSAATLAYVLLGAAGRVWPSLAAGRLRLALPLLAAGRLPGLRSLGRPPPPGPRRPRPRGVRPGAPRSRPQRGLPGGGGRGGGGGPGPGRDGRPRGRRPGPPAPLPRRAHPARRDESSAAGSTCTPPPPRRCACGCPPGPTSRPAWPSTPPPGAKAPGGRGALRAGGGGARRAPGAAGAPPQPPGPGRGAGLGRRVGRPRPPGRAGGAPGAAHGGRGRPPLRLGRLGQPPGRPLDRRPPPPRHPPGVGHPLPPR